MRVTGLVCVALALVSLEAPPVRAQATGSWSRTWTESEGRLVVDIPYAALDVAGWDVDSVRVAIRDAGGGVVPLPSPRVVGSEVRIVAPGNQTLVELEIRIPHRFDIVLRSSNGSPIRVSEVHGAVVVENSNAGVHLSGLRGPVLAATSNGPLTASFGELPERGPLSFITSNDSVSVSFPRPPGVDLFLETDNGRILSDFPLESSTESGDPREAAGGRSVLRARVGPGGPLLRIRTDNGDIALRRGGPG